jgi:hypothetical protein
VTQRFDSAATSPAVAMCQGTAPLRPGHRVALATKRSSPRLTTERALLRAKLPPVHAPQFSTAEALSP